MLLFALFAGPATPGVLITRSDAGLQFADSFTVVVNGKDKASTLGEQPKASVPFSKLQSTKLGGTLLRDRDTGIIGEYENDKLQYLIPQNLPKGTAENPAAVWQTAKITSKASNSDKAGTEVPPASFVAFLPGGVEELVRICTDPTALAVIGGKGKTVATETELMSAVVHKYAGNAEIAPLERNLEQAMRSRYIAFEAGGAKLDVLMEGLEFAKLSQAVYPASAEHEKLRHALATLKAWLDRRIAIMKSLAAADQWDAYLIASRDFEKFQTAYPEIAAQRRQVLQQSQQMHSKVGLLRKQEGDYAGAFRQFRLASARKPSDVQLRDEAMQAWTEYSLRQAMEQQSRRVTLSAGPRQNVDRYLFDARQNRETKKLDEALKSVLDAEGILKNSLKPGAFSKETLDVLKMKAEVLAAEERYGEALSALETHDLYAVDADRAAAETQRNQMLFTMNKLLSATKNSLQRSWTAGDFPEVRRTAVSALRMKGDDPDLLYWAGLSGLMLREPKEGTEQLNRYLQVSETLDAKPEERARVIKLLANQTAGAGPVQGDGPANWMSGWKAPSGSFYCPISVAFTPAIDRIEGSGKLRVGFDWDGERLRAATPTLEGNGVLNDKKLSFAYLEQTGQVFWASDDETARQVAPKNYSEGYAMAATVLPNSPFVDPIAVERVTGKNVAVGIAFNKFFNPFVWEKLYYFQFIYDVQGRVISAQELKGPRGAPGEQILQFEWNGSQLAAIRGYIGKFKNYERTMQYQGGRLVSEEIQGQGKTSRIKYTYANNRLVSAEAGNDPTLDNRSRKIAFRQASPSTVVK